MSFTIHMPHWLLLGGGLLLVGLICGGCLTLLAIGVAIRGAIGRGLNW